MAGIVTVAGVALVPAASESEKWRQEVSSFSHQSTPMISLI